MQSLGIKKFFVDHLIGSVLIVLLFFLSIGNMTALFLQPVYDLNQACTSSLTSEDVLNSLKDVLHTGESCALMSPCEGTETVQCEAPLSINTVIYQFIHKDLMVFRIHKTLVETYGVWSYQYPVDFKVPMGFIIVLLVYGWVLLEASATLFAIWRQNKLKQTLSLPPGSRRDQLLMPVLYAVLWGVFVVSLNFQVFNRFDYPETEYAETLRNLMNSGTGILIAVVLAPLAEELMFRGVLLRFFIERNRVLTGTIIVSMLFSAFHGFVEQSLGWQLYISSIYFLASIILCRLYISQKNIWTPILFHSAFNSTTIGLSLFLG